MTSSGGNSATVGFHLDDIPLNGPASAQNGHVVIDPDLYDLNRVEILRGPQGTLFGSGSMGGTVRLISNQPWPTLFRWSAETRSARSAVTFKAPPSRSNTRARTLIKSTRRASLSCGSR
jgi:outer membrane receptor protein involved in Fe transport